MASLRHGVLMVSELSASSEVQAPLRIGAVVESVSVPAWVAELLAEIDGAEFLELDALVVPPTKTRPRRRLELIPTKVRTALHRAYVRLDRRAFRVPHEALATVDLTERLPHLATVRVAIQPGDQGADPEAAPAVRGLDLLLLLGPSAPSRSVLAATRFGAWRVRFGAGNSLSDSIGVRDVRSASELCEIVVEAVAEAGGTVVDRAWTSRDPISLHRTRTHAYWRAAHAVMGSLRDLQASGGKGLPPLGSVAPDTNEGEPANREMISHLAVLGSRAVARQVRGRLFRERWFLAYRRRRPGVEPGEAMDEFKLVDTPVGRSFMDPFLVEWDGVHFIFFEDFRERIGRGVISVIELDAEGNASPPRVVLERDYHLSYPFVFSHGGELYMIPETAANRTIELYRATAFPDRWALDRVLMSDLTAVDSTVFEHGDRFWLFASMRRPGTRLSDELSLFVADSPFGPWTPHERNPIVCDPRSARPAGRTFREGGDLIRPSQDSSASYGRAVVFNRIDVLDETDYRETSIGRIEPGWIRGNVGTHTYNRDAVYEVVDGRRLVARGLSLHRR